MNTLTDTSRTLVSSSSGLGVAVRRDQEIPEDFLAGLRADRDASSAPAGNYHRYASVPVAVAELWLRQGFDIYQEPAKAIIKRLQDHGLDAFITSSKRI